MIPEIMEEDEDEEMDEIEEVDQFGPEIIVPSDLDAAVTDTGEPYTEPVSPISPLPSRDEDRPEPKRSGSGGVPLTAEALAKMQEEEEMKEKQGATI